MWNLHQESKQQNAQKAKQILENLNGKIPGLLKIEVGIDLIGDNNTADILLYSEFESEQALNDYRVHPEHEKVLPFMKSIIADRHVMDYSI